jgi:hypothetical protein
MKYYLHDTSSFDDEKITELFMNFGYEGLGLFYTILEKIAKQEKPIKTKVLKAQLKVGKKLEKIWKFLEEIELISSNFDETFNKQLLKYSEKYKIKSEKNAKKISEWRENQENKKNVTSYEPFCNASKVKLSKVNLVKEENTQNINELQNRLQPHKSNIEIYKEYSLNAQNENYKSFINVLLLGKNNSGAFSKLLTLEPITESKYNIVVMQLRGSGMTPDQYENILEIMEGHVSISRHTDLNSYLLKFIQNHKKRD